MEKHVPNVDLSSATPFRATQWAAAETAANYIIDWNPPWLSPPLLALRGGDVFADTSLISSICPTPAPFPSSGRQISGPLHRRGTSFRGPTTKDIRRRIAPNVAEYERAGAPATRDQRAAKWPTPEGTASCRKGGGSGKHEKTIGHNIRGFGQGFHLPKRPQAPKVVRWAKFIRAPGRTDPTTYIMEPFKPITYPSQLSQAHHGSNLKFLLQKVKVSTTPRHRLDLTHRLEGCSS